MVDGSPKVISGQIAILLTWLFHLLYKPRRQLKSAVSPAILLSSAMPHGRNAQLSKGEEMVLISISLTLSSHAIIPDANK